MPCSSVIAMRAIVPGIVIALQPGVIALRLAAVHMWRVFCTSVSNQAGPAVAVYTGGESLGLDAGCWALGVVSIQDWLLTHSSSNSKGFMASPWATGALFFVFGAFVQHVVHPGRSL